MNGSLDHGLLFQIKSLNLLLQGFADADSASDPDDCKSTSGVCIHFGGNLIAWSSKKQSIISHSSTEAEYRSLAHVSAELVGIQSLFADLLLPMSSLPVVWCDNLGVVHLSANPVLHSRSKHVELDIYFVRDLVLQKRLRICHLPTSAQVADIFTKPLSAVHFLPLRSKLNVVDSTTIGLRRGAKRAH